MGHKRSREPLEPLPISPAHWTRAVQVCLLLICPAQGRGEESRALTRCALAISTLIRCVQSHREAIKHTGLMGGSCRRWAGASLLPAAVGVLRPWELGLVARMKFPEAFAAAGDEAAAGVEQPRLSGSGLHGLSRGLSHTCRLSGFAFEAAKALTGEGTSPIYLWV